MRLLVIESGWMGVGLDWHDLKHGIKHTHSRHKLFSRTCTPKLPSIQGIFRARKEVGDQLPQISKLLISPMVLFLNDWRNINTIQVAQDTGKLQERDPFPLWYTAWLYICILTSLYLNLLLHFLSFVAHEVVSLSPAALSLGCGLPGLACLASWLVWWCWSMRLPGLFFFSSPVHFFSVILLMLVRSDCVVRVAF